MHLERISSCGRLRGLSGFICLAFLGIDFRTFWRECRRDSESAGAKSAAMQFSLRKQGKVLFL